MPFDACGLGQLGPRFEVQSGRAIWRRAQAHLRVRGRPNQFARNPSALLRGELGCSTWSRNWRVARVISTFTLCQYEHALSQINKGIQVSFVHIVFASVAAVSTIGRPTCRASGWAGMPPVCQGKQPGRRNRSSLESAWRPPCCRGPRRVDLASRPAWAGSQTVPVCFGRLSPAAGSRASREVQTTGRDVWSLRMRWLRHHKSGACTRTEGRIRTAQVPWNFHSGRAFSWQSKSKRRRRWDEVSCCG